MASVCQANDIVNLDNETDAALSHALVAVIARLERSGHVDAALAVGAELCAVRRRMRSVTKVQVAR